jgi:hypothetical protein
LKTQQSVRDAARCPRKGIILTATKLVVAVA